MNMTQFLPLMIAGFAAAVGFTPVTRFMAFRFGVLAQPSSRNIHKSPTPLMGGLAIYGAFLVAMLLFSPPLYLREFSAVIAGTTWLTLVGFVDDRNGMQPLIKMSAQIIAGLVLIAAGIQVRVFSTDLLNIPVTLLWIVGITNAINFQDNMDGLAAGITAIASIFFFVMALREELSLVSSLAAAMTGASVGFLVYNFNPATTFMGDMGSMVLGFILSVLALKLDFNVPAERQAVTWMVPVVVLGLPIFDTTLVTFTRLREGRSPMQGGKDHSSHRLVSLGMGQRTAVVILYLACIALGFTAIALSHASIESGVIISGILAVAAITAFIFMEITYIHHKRDI